MEENYFNQIPEYTPDVAKLDQAPSHLVFDPGPILYNVPFHCTAYTMERMSLWRHKNGHQAEAIIFRMDAAPRARVRGTLYSMSTDMIKKLDNYKQNGVSFERTRVPIVVPVLGEPERFPHLVWMYKAVKNRWEDRIISSIGSRHLSRGCTHSSEFQLADVYPNNNRFFHNHFGYSGVPIEARNLPEIEVCTPSEAFIKHIDYKNQREIARISGPIRNAFFKLRGYF